MAGNKILTLAAGHFAEVESNNSSAGAGDANKLVSLNSSGKIDETMMPNSIGSDSKTMEASETLSAGDLINIHDSTGEKIRKADASNGRKAHGFVLGAVTSGQSGTVFFDATITGLTGLTPGVDYFLSASTPGAATSTPVSGAGEISQPVGHATSTTELSFEPGMAITLA